MYKHKSAFFSHSKGVYVSKKKIWEKKKKEKIFQRENICKAKEKGYKSPQ